MALDRDMRVKARDRGRDFATNGVWGNFGVAFAPGITAALMATNKSNLLVLDESNRVRRELLVLLDARAIDVEIAAARAARFVAPDDDDFKHERSA